MMKCLHNLDQFKKSATRPRPLITDDSEQEVLSKPYEIGDEVEICIDETGELFEVVTVTDYEFGENYVVMITKTKSGSEMRLLLPPNTSQ